MGIKANAEKVIMGIDRLADAYAKARGYDMGSVTLTKAQFDSVEEAIAKDKIGCPNWDGKKLFYKGIKLNIQ